MIGAFVGPSSRLWTPDPALKATVEAMPYPAALVDVHGHLAFCNSAWKSMGGRIGTYGDLGSLVTPDDHDGAVYAARLAKQDGPLAGAARRLSRAIQDALAGRSDGPRIAYAMRRPSGDEPFEADVRALPNGTGHVALIQHLPLADRQRAADLEQLAERLGLALQDAQASGRRLARHLEEAGRDLHVPLTPAKMELYLLERGAFGALSDEQQRALALVRRNVERLAALEHAIVAAPSKRGVAQDVDLSAVAAGVADAHSTQALQQGIRLVHPASLPLPVRADPEVVRDALDLLIGRAVQSTPAGGTVIVEARRDGRDGIVEVTDGGGLSSRELRTVFEPMAEAQAGGAPDFSLAHVRSVLHGIGGRVTAESEGPGQGLRLGLVLPLVPASA